MKRDIERGWGRASMCVARDWRNRCVCVSVCEDKRTVGKGKAHT